MARRVYPVVLVVNDRKISKVIIDSHFEEKHSATVNDEIILALVQLLHKGTYPSEANDGEFEYFVVDGCNI
jgi:hypothetical protein